MKQKPGAGEGACAYHCWSSDEMAILGDYDLTRVQGEVTIVERSKHDYDDDDKDEDKGWPISEGVWAYFLQWVTR